MWTAIQTYIFAMKYLESSIQMSVRKPCCTFKCINVMLWVGALGFTMIVVAVVSYQLVKFPGQVNDGSFQELFVFLDGPFTESNGFVTWPWLILHFCSSCVQCYAIWKIYETTEKLNSCSINMRTMIIHLSCIITQDLVMIMAIVPGKIEIGFRNGVEVDAFGHLDMWLTLVDAIIEYIICYICWTMGSSAQLRRVKCIITQTQAGEY